MFIYISKYYILMQNTMYIFLSSSSEQFLLDDYQPEIYNKKDVIPTILSTQLNLY